MEIKTFDQLREEQNAVRRNSDLSNLANAHMMLDESIERWEECIAKAKAIQTEIEAVGKAEKPPTLSVVKELYDRAHKARRD